ncbi:MAG: histidine kinase [Draconibacterium sp.]|nr:histidine kinase [Draconibacterium sp.]
MNRFLFDNNIRYRLFRHILFFLITVLLFAAILYAQNQTGNFSNTLFITFINATFFFGYAYITLFLLIPEFLLTRKIGWFIVLFLLVGIALSAIKFIVSDHIFYSSISPENIQQSGFIEFRFILVNTKDMTFIVALFCIAKYVKDYLYTEQVRKKLESENKMAQAKLIQSQFDPHFLFNTINNLYALSLLDPLKTKEVVKRIKIVLQYLNTEIQKDYVYLKDEIILVENYIQLEKLRYGDRLKVEFIVDNNLNKFKIPPMVLFLLVENCFKYGSSLDAGNPWIKISLKTENSKIYLTTENSKPKTYENRELFENGNYDLKNLRKRLKIIYSPNGYKLATENFENTFKVNIELKEGFEIIQNKYR